VIGTQCQAAIFTATRTIKDESLMKISAFYHLVFIQEILLKSGFLIKIVVWDQVFSQEMEQFR
jgi:hypothetical protein